MLKLLLQPLQPLLGLGHLEAVLVSLSPTISNFGKTSRHLRRHQQSMFEDPLERQYWMTIWEKLFSTGIPDSWAYRWSLVCMANSGLTTICLSKIWSPILALVMMQPTPQDWQLLSRPVDSRMIQHPPFCDLQRCEC